MSLTEGNPASLVMRGQRLNLLNLLNLLNQFNLFNQFKKSSRGKLENSL